MYVNHYETQTLIQLFSQSVRNPSTFQPDDALEYIINNEEVNHIVNSILIVGSYPWENDTTPKILYCSHENPLNDVEISLALDCFPKGKTEIYDVIIPKQELNPHVIKEVKLNDLEFFAISYLANDEAPYVFCYGYDASSFTFPSFAHNLTASEIVSQYENEILMMTKIFICFLTKFPYNDIFNEIVLWLLRSERIGRFFLHDYIIQITSTQTISHVETDNDYPITQRNKMKEIITELCNKAPPLPGQKLEIDLIPYPPLSWERPILDQSSFPIYTMASLIETVRPPLFLAIFKTLCLEKSFVVYHSDITKVSNFIWALYFALKPLQLNAKVITVLSTRYIDFIDSPVPMIFGTTFKLEDYNNIIFFDLERKEAKGIKNFGKFEMFDNLLPILESKWSPENAQLILKMLNDVMQKIIERVKKSIITNRSDNNAHSMFEKNLFLGRFVHESRPFLNEMCNTPSFKLMVEQKCREKSESCNQ
ncbi:DENN (AEX-3) domain-containing protein [Histomonas meleagridis]|uniref:DENN (AEX-3) domain-containing protein n=1 Tax=Histomonas meleagridis TaxID=135588 RepID=UPI0035595FB7|nr:DENN (AEX-3) domain-containing protein [Histomonas meleagridis]KAH0799726.1 DENN (AEX-3) domain-containing protein [Histomonas meleagridis]